MKLRLQCQCDFGCDLFERSYHPPIRSSKGDGKNKISATHISRRHDGFHIRN